jgi:aldose 1-epimerase
MGIRLFSFALLFASVSCYASVKKTDWGMTSDKQKVDIYTLRNENLVVRITNYGARVVSIDAPDRAGKKADVVLGYASLAAYEADKGTYFGSIVGRYGNRIASGKSSIEGTAYSIPTNHGLNALHGGTIGLDRKVWTAKIIAEGVEMSLVSQDGDMGLQAHSQFMCVTR